MSKKFFVSSKELHLWQAKPAQAANLIHYAKYGGGLFLSFVLLSAIPILPLAGVFGFAYKILDKFMEVKDSKFDLTHERMRIVVGGIIKGRRTYEIDIKDLKDVRLHESAIDQIFGLGSIELEFISGALNTYRELYKSEYHVLRGIENADEAREIIRASIKDTVNRETLNPNNMYGMDFNKKNKQKYLNN